MKYPRTLVISNNCFSTTNSNGRTLGNFFINYEKESLAQFYIHNDVPDYTICNNYFRVTDSEALKAFIKGGQKGTIIKKEPIGEEKFEENIDNDKRKFKRTPLTFMLRDLVWNSRRWKGNNFIEWIDRFNPEIILIQAGDCIFMLKLALDIAKKKNIPLIIYNSESYYFKEKNYLESGFISSILYRIWHKKYKRIFNKVIDYADHSIYNCDMLKDAYQNEFNKKATTLMTASNIEFDLENISSKIKKQNIKVAYLGNLGLGRHEVLIEIANCLQDIDTNIKLDVYGKIPNQEVGKAFKKCNGIIYNGVISYEEVLSVMKNSDLLVHGENFSKFYRWDLKYAFSTKIADCISSGTCFFVYAPEDMASTKYLLENNSACVATNKKDLYNKLYEVIKYENKREYYIRNALQISSKRHNYKINKEKFQEILFNVARNKIK